MVIGSRIRKARLDLNLSQEQLGNLIGVSKVSICGYENETKIPSLQNFLDLASNLNVTLDYLLGNDTEVVKEDTKVTIKIRKEELKLLSELRNNKELYNFLIEEPSRTIKLINKKLFD